MTGGRLGRLVRHDPRSLRYTVKADGTAQSVTWQRMVPIFDQGDTGSCTGNAAAGVLGTMPFKITLPASFVDDEQEARALYSAAEIIDGGAGLPTEDEGSSGLSVAKAAKNAGLISGYQHITSVAAALTAIQAGPFIVGTEWLSSFDEPEPDGLVTMAGQSRGGHEYECYGYDAAMDRWLFCNSWGNSWGPIGGKFMYTSATFARLLSMQGDATVFVPLTQPAPIPTPSPAPAAPATALTTLNVWAGQRHTGSNKQAAAAWVQVSPYVH